MHLRTAAGGLSRFAHLAGIVRPKAKAEGDEPEDEERKKREPEAEDEKDEDEREDDARAEEDEEEKDAERDEEGPEDEEPKDKDGKQAFAAGRKAERARCAAIVAAASGPEQMPLAAHLAFETDMPVKAAVGALRVAAAAVPKRAGLADRMASVPPINVGADQASDPPASKTAEAAQLASRILAAARAAGLKL